MKLRKQQILYRKTAYNLAYAYICISRCSKTAKLNFIPYKCETYRAYALA